MTSGGRRVRTLGVLGAMLLVLAACGEDTEVAEEPGDPDPAEEDPGAEEPAEDTGQEPVTLSFVSAFPIDQEINEGFRLWMETVQEEAPWIEIDYRGGPDVMDPTQQIEGIGSGAVDAGTMPGDYYVQQAPAAEIMRFTPYTPAEEREEGIFELYEQFHAEALNVQYLGRTMAGVPQVLFLSDQELTEPDLSGLTIRTSPATAPVVAALGGAPADLPAEEIYTALERGTVDGFGWASVGPRGFGWHEQAAYELAPRFYESAQSLVVNKDVWDGLEPGTQQALMDITADLEPEIVETYQDLALEEVEAWRDAGVELIEFTGDDAARVLTVAYEEGWDAVGWDEIVEATPVAEEIRESYEAGYGEDYETAVPGGTTFKPQGE